MLIRFQGKQRFYMTQKLGFVSYLGTYDFLNISCLRPQILYFCKLIHNPQDTCPISDLTFFLSSSFITSLMSNHTSHLPYPQTAPSYFSLLYLSSFLLSTIFYFPNLPRFFSNQKQNKLNKFQSHISESLYNIKIIF